MLSNRLPRSTGYLFLLATVVCAAPSSATPAYQVATRLLVETCAYPACPQGDQNCGGQGLCACQTPPCGPNARNCCGGKQDCCNNVNDCCPNLGLACPGAVGKCCNIQGTVCSADDECCPTTAGYQGAICSSGSCLDCKTNGYYPLFLTRQCCLQQVDHDPDQTHSRCCSGVSQKCALIAADGGSDCCDTRLNGLHLTCGPAGFCCVVDGSACSTGAQCCSGTCTMGACAGPC
jgi:hypothetical protein